MGELGINMINKTEISAFQLVFLLIHVQIGVGIINLPFDIFIVANSDAWISILLSGIFIQLIILGYSFLIKRFPNHTIYDIHLTVLGKWLGSLLIVVYILFYIMSGSLVLANFVYYIKTWLMPKTPSSVLIGLMCLAGIYIIKENIQIIARFLVLCSVFLIGFIVAAIYSFKYSDITFIMPIGESGITPIMKGIGPSFFSFQGFEMLLIFFPFVKASNRTIIKSASIANLFVTLFYTLLVLVSLLFFSKEELKRVPEPILYLVKAFSFRMIERPDLLFTSMWIVLVATSFTVFMYGASLGVMTLTKTSRLTYVATILTAICFIISLNIKGVYYTTQASTFFQMYLIPPLVFFPFLLIILALIRRKKGVKNE